MFDVTFEIVTPESAECGDVEHRGYIARDVSLREALRLVAETRTSHCGGVEGIEANESPLISPRSVTIYNGAEYLTGACENRSLHMSERLTASTRCRIARLVGNV